MRDTVASGYILRQPKANARLRLMEENRVNKIKLDQLRNDIQAGIASGDAGTLDVDEIKRRGRTRYRAALRETERRYKAGMNNPSIEPSPSRWFEQGAEPDNNKPATDIRR